VVSEWGLREGAVIGALSLRTPPPPSGSAGEYPEIGSLGSLETVTPLG